MGKVRQKLAEKSQIKQIFMDCGRLPIDSSSYEWINPTTRQKHTGTVLEIGPNGYVELNLADKEQARVYERFVEWMKEGTDPRISRLNIHELKEGDVKPPFSWWMNSKDVELVKDVLRATDSMETVEQREAFVEQCVLFEKSQDKPRKALIEKLLDLELEASVDDPMNPKIETTV